MNIFNDVNTRLNENTTYASTYHFWWTSTTYLSSFIWILTLNILWALSARYFNNRGILVSWVGMLFSVETIDFSQFNINWYNSKYVYIGTNNLLTNSLNCYHPGILYSSFLLLLLTFFFYKNSLISRQYYLYVSYLSITQTCSYHYITLNSLALFLGSWWALQEGTWGGWWNWDTSEVLGWLITLFFLTNTHSTCSYTWVQLWLSKQLFLALIILFVYVLVQLSFELTAHNFGLKFFYFFNNNLFLLEMLSLMLIVVLYLSFLILRWNYVIQIINKNIKRARTTNRKIRIFLRLIFVLLITMLIFLSVEPLLNYTLWALLCVNGFILIHVNSNLILSILFCIHMLLIRSYFCNLYLILFYLLTSCGWLWLPLLQFRSLKALYVLHWFVLNFIALNWIIVMYNISYWTLNSLTETAASSEILWVFNHKLRISDSRILEHVCENYTDQDHRIDSWILFQHVNSSNVNLFALELTHVSMKNLYHLAQTYTFTLLSLELPFTAYLSIIYGASTITYLLFRSKTNLIM